ncbi:hypothetical protein [Lentibacillus jeotgali]|uniref:hypothetical protein n=1 Tax=Lentibacillus jeotgali TaxID=558169 RepID=UPI000262589A|nr:hypothetical protein [Lentibacillus jeotgali]
MFKGILDYCKGIFIRNKRESEAPEAPKQDKHVTRINQLKQELTSLTYGYNKSLAGLKADYNSKLTEYERYYQQYKDVFKQYTKKLASEHDVKDAEQALKPYEESLQEASEELDKVQGFKKEDTLNIINQIQELQDAYTNALAEEIQQTANKLQHQKQAYLKGVVSVGKAYQDAIDTDKVIERHLKEFGFNHNAKMAEMLGIKTEKAPVSLQHLTISDNEVNQALQGIQQYK